MPRYKGRTACARPRHIAYIDIPTLKPNFVTNAPQAVRLYMSTETGMGGPPDATLLDRYLAGECDGDEGTMIERYLQANPEVAHRLSLLAGNLRASHPIALAHNAVPRDGNSKTWGSLVVLVRTTKEALCPLARYPSKRLRATFSAPPMTSAVLTLSILIGVASGEPALQLPGKLVTIPIAYHPPRQLIGV